MDLSKKIKLNDVTTEQIKLPCRVCNQKTLHKFWLDLQEDWNHDDYISGQDHYQVVSCLGCEDVSFRHTSWDTESFNYDHEGNILDGSERVSMFPERLVGRPLMKEVYLLPIKVQDAYKETHTALTKDSRILAGVGIRILIEAVCKERGAEGMNLENRINDLVTKKVLTEDNAQIIHQMRFLGNKSAHEIEAAKRSDLGLAFDIVENLLQSVYIIPMKARGDVF